MKTPLTRRHFLETSALEPTWDSLEQNYKLPDWYAKYMPALSAWVQKFTPILEPYQVPEGDPRRARPPGWIKQKSTPY
jgi:hypothetical protein